MLGRISRMKDDEPSAVQKLNSIQKYVSTSGIPQAALLKMAKLGAVVDDWMKSADVQISAVQCWTSLEENLGVVPCTVMSMMSNSPSRAPARSMCAAFSACTCCNSRREPPALCSIGTTTTAPIPTKLSASIAAICRSISSADVTMDFQAIIAGTVGKDNTFGTCVGKVKSGAMSFARFSTDDLSGKIRGYSGGGRFTDDPLETFGGAKCR